MCAQVAPSGECLRGYKPCAVDCSRLVLRVAASCQYLCCLAWQLVDCVKASAFVICVIKNYFTLLFWGLSMGEAISLSDASLPHR